MATETPIPPMTNEELLYSVLDKMTKPQLEEMRQNIDEEIELRKFKESRIKKIKADIERETNRMIAKYKSDYEHAKSEYLDFDSEEEEEDDEIVPPIKKKSPIRLPKKIPKKK